MVCGMLNTKDIAGYMHPLADQVRQFYGVSIPGQAATVSAADAVKAAKSVGMTTQVAESVEAAIQAIVTTDATARILICGSLYLAGEVLRDNG